MRKRQICPPKNSQELNWNFTMFVLCMGWYIFETRANCQCSPRTHKHTPNALNIMFSALSVKPFSYSQTNSIRHGESKKKKKNKRKRYKHTSQTFINLMNGGVISNVHAVRYCSMVSRRCCDDAFHHRQCPRRLMLLTQWTCK